MRTFNKLLFGFILSSASIGGYAQTTVPQIISSNATWTAANSPYIVTQNVLVKNGSMVKVEPGTKIRGTGNFRIIMESGAGFEAKGTKDSVILIDTVNFDFLKGAVGYNFTTGAGSIFSYCFFRGTGMGGVQTITLAESPLLVTNCRFWNTYYTIYGPNSNTTPVKVRIEKSLFEGTKFNYGYVIYPIGNYSELEMDECVVKSMYGLFLASTNTITKCLFYDWVSNGGFNLNWTKKATFKCNTFRKFKSSIFEIGSPNPATSEIVIVSNTFDSADYHIDYRVSTTPYAKFVCKNNNFLHYNKNSVKIGGGSKPGYADTLVFTKNYWGTTSSSQIASGIWDISDDITIAGLVDFSSFQTSMVNDCIEDESEEAFMGGLTSLNELRNAGFSVYPNPVNNVVRIKSENIGSAAWSINSLSGAVLMTGTTEGNESAIDVSTLTPGFYILELSKQGAIIGTKKLTLQR